MIRECGKEYDVAERGGARGAERHAMTRTDVCVHGSLRRQCETCDLAEELAEARAQVAALLGLLSKFSHSLEALGFDRTDDFIADAKIIEKRWNNNGLAWRYLEARRALANTAAAATAHDAAVREPLEAALRVLVLYVTGRAAGLTGEHPDAQAEEILSDPAVRAVLPLEPR
jgi:hypothetical protein